PGLARTAARDRLRAADRRGAGNALDARPAVAARRGVDRTGQLPAVSVALAVAVVRAHPGRRRNRAAAAAGAGGARLPARRPHLVAGGAAAAAPAACTHRPGGAAAGDG